MAAYMLADAAAGLFKIGELLTGGIQYGVSTIGDAGKGMWKLVGDKADEIDGGAVINAVGEKVINAG